eukprot:symbB.v1.2.042401.t1/scaffold9958.1/size2140/1
MTSGLLSLGQESWDRGRELMEQHSKPIQEGFEAWQKEVADKTESLQQNLHESLGNNALKIKKGIDKGREQLSSLSCSSATAYQKGLQDEEVVNRFPSPQ